MNSTDSSNTKKKDIDAYYVAETNLRHQVHIDVMANLEKESFGGKKYHQNHKFDCLCYKY